MKSSKTIVLTGGGSGGHLTPILSVAEVLRHEAPEYKLVYIGQKGDGLGDIMHSSNLFDKVYTVRAGKFRRYHGEGWRQLLDIKTLFLNIRDIVYVFIGLVQAWRLLGKLKPKVVFSRGGFVSVPVCLGAAIRRIPYITHDSDAIPSLANRIISKWARVHAVALPKEQYKYPANKTITVGVPVQKGFKLVTPQLQSAAKAKLKIANKSWTILVIGGGLGAERVNDAVIKAAKQLFKNIDLSILHVAGRKSEEAVNASYDQILPSDQRAKVKVFGFTDDVVTLGEAADIVITRAGATNMAEFALQGKACIIVPNPLLTGGHQLKNAKVYADAGAALIMSEQHLDQLADMIIKLHNDKPKQQQLASSITQFANKNAAASLAGILIALSQKD